MRWAGDTFLPAGQASVFLRGLNGSLPFMVLELDESTSWDTPLAAAPKPICTGNDTGGTPVSDGTCRAAQEGCDMRAIQVYLNIRRCCSLRCSIGWFAREQLLKPRLWHWDRRPVRIGTEQGGERVACGHVPSGPTSWLRAFRPGVRSALGPAAVPALGAVPVPAIVTQPIVGAVDRGTTLALAESLNHRGHHTLGTPRRSAAFAQ